MKQGEKMQPNTSKKESDGIGEGRCSKSIKYVRSKKELHHLIRGWALDMNTLEELDQADIHEVIILDTDTGLIYQADLLDFAKHGLPVLNDLDHRLCLPIRHWTICKEDPR